MRAEIFVVKTELTLHGTAEDKKSLRMVLNDIIREFGGASVISDVNGYWMDESGHILLDDVECWLIYSDSADFFEIIEDFNKRIKKITVQKSQAFGIDGKLFFV